MKIAYLDCFSGISGDMFLGALVDAGVPFSVLDEAVSALNLDAHLSLRRVNRSGIDAAKVDVLTSEETLVEPLHPEDHTHGHDHTHTHAHEHDHAHSHSHSHSHDPQPSDHSHSHAHTNGRSLSTIQQLIRNSPLAPAVQATASKAFELLGHAEAKIHNVPVETIHFHEVGAVDAIADIVATSAGCHWLQIDRWFCSPLNVGSGHVHCAHGKYPVPAPATLELLQGLPIYSSAIQKELVTPTGAALLRALNVTSSQLPLISMSTTGYGAGSRDLPEQPNVLRLIVGESADLSSSPTPAASKHKTKVGVIETTIDDATPELLAYVADRLLAAGASDVYRTPIVMKKGRAGVQLTVLCDPAQAEALRRLVFHETTTLGLRYREEEKIVAERSFAAVETAWGNVRIKVGTLEDANGNDQIVNHAPEYEDCRAIAEKHSIPLKQVMQAAVAVYLDQAPKT